MKHTSVHAYPTLRKMRAEQKREAVASSKQWKALNCVVKIPHSHLKESKSSPIWKVIDDKSFLGDGTHSHHKPVNCYSTKIEQGSCHKSVEKNWKKLAKEAFWFTKNPVPAIIKLHFRVNQFSVKLKIYNIKHQNVCHSGIRRIHLHLAFKYCTEWIKHSEQALLVHSFVFFVVTG